MLLKGSATRAILMTVLTTSCFAGVAKVYSKAQTTIQAKTKISVLHQVSMQTPFLDTKVKKKIVIPSIAHIKAPNKVQFKNRIEPTEVLEVSGIQKLAPAGIEIDINDDTHEELNEIDRQSLISLIEYPKLFGRDAVKIVDIKKLEPAIENKIEEKNEYPKQDKQPLQVITSKTLKDNAPDGLDLLGNLNPEIDIQKIINPKKDKSIPVIEKKTEEKMISKQDAPQYNVINFLPINERASSLTPSPASKSTVPIQAPTQNPNDNEYSKEKSPSISMAAVNTDEIKNGYSGVVTESFSMGKKAVQGAFVQILGTPWNTKTDANGFFSFEKIHVVGVLPVVISKDEYLNRRIDLAENNLAQIELISENSVSFLGMAASEKFKLGSSFLFGQLASSKEKVNDFTVEVSTSTGIISQKIVYFDEKGIPNPKLTKSTSNGQFMVLNVNSGTYSLNIKKQGNEERAPHLIYLGNEEGLIKKFNLGDKLEVKGKLLNAQNNKVVADAQIQLLGTTLQVKTNKKGEFNFGSVYIDCYDHNYIQIEKKGYYRNRNQYYCNTEKQNYFAFSSAYVDGAAIEAEEKLNPSTGIVIGNTRFNESVKVQLWGPNEFSNDPNKFRGKDFYLENDGILNIELNRSTKNGNFIIFQAPEELSYLQTFDQKNNTLMYWPVYFGASTVNVFVQ